MFQRRHVTHCIVPRMLKKHSISNARDGPSLQLIQATSSVRVVEVSWLRTQKKAVRKWSLIVTLATITFSAFLTLTPILVSLSDHSVRLVLFSPFPQTFNLLACPRQLPSRVVYIATIPPYVALIRSKGRQLHPIESFTRSCHKMGINASSISLYMSI